MKRVRFVRHQAPLGGGFVVWQRRLGGGWGLTLSWNDPPFWSRPAVEVGGDGRGWWAVVGWRLTGVVFSWVYRHPGVTAGRVVSFLNRRLHDGNAGIIVGDVTQTTHPDTVACYSGGAHIFQATRHPSGQGPARVDTAAGQPIARFEPAGDGHVRIVDAETWVPDEVVAGDVWTLACERAEKCAAAADDFLLPF